MAPPPPASMPLGQRLTHLAQTLQFAWFVGHVTLLLSTLRYGLSYITFNFASRWARFSYRTAFLSAAVTYGIVVYKAYRARIRTGKQGGALAMATDENVQYLGKLAIPSVHGETPALTYATAQEWRLCGYSHARSLWRFFHSQSIPYSMLQRIRGRICFQLCSHPNRAQPLLAPSLSLQLCLKKLAGLLRSTMTAV